MLKVQTCPPSTALSSLPYIEDGPVNPNHPPQQDQGLQGESNFSDGSEALFSMYLRRAREEDRKMAEGWKGYADGMLVFVSPRAPSHYPPIMYIVDWPILCCRRRIARSDHPGYSAKSTGHHSLLPRTN